MDIEPRQGGFVKLSRHILDIPLPANSLAIYTYMLLKACYKDGAVAYGTPLKKGQLILKTSTLEEHFNLGRQAIRTSLGALKSNQMITIKTTNKFSIVTICNYCDSDDFNEDKKPSIQPTANQQITNKKPTNNQLKEKEGKEREERKESLKEKNFIKKENEDFFAQFVEAYPKSDAEVDREHIRTRFMAITQGDDNLARDIIKATQIYRQEREREEKNNPENKRWTKGPINFLECGAYRDILAGKTSGGAYSATAQALAPLRQSSCVSEEVLNVTESKHALIGRTIKETKNIRFVVERLFQEFSELCAYTGSSEWANQFIAYVTEKSPTESFCA